MTDRLAYSVEEVCAMLGVSHVTVYAGDSITTTVKVWNYPTCAYYPANCETVWFTDQTHSASATVVFSDTLGYDKAVGGVLEAYGLTSCSEFPSGGARFRDIQVQEASLSQPMNVNNSSIYSVYLTNPSWYQLFSVPTSPTCNWSVVPSVTPAPPPYYWPWDVYSFATLSW